MKNKNLLVGLVVAAFITAAIFIIAKPTVPKKLDQKAKAPQKTQKGAAKAEKGKPAAPAKKTFSIDTGGLTVKILGSGNREMSLRIRAFKSTDIRSSAYVTAFTSNRMQELSPGNYDIEIDTIPQKIYKNIKVSSGKETIEDLGCITGSINIKALNAKKKDAFYPVRIFYPKSNVVITTTTTNRPVEIMPGLYDVEIGTLPKQVKKDVKVESSKETALDPGLTPGTLIVKALDENKKELRYGVVVAKAENSEFVTSTAPNRPVEILAGTYNVEIASSPKQTKKGLKVNAGEETTVEFLIQAPQAPQIPSAKTKK